MPLKKEKGKKTIMKSRRLKNDVLLKSIIGSSVGQKVKELIRGL
jgi:hypothetical protein